MRVLEIPGPAGPLEAKLEEVDRIAPRVPEPPYYARWWFWLGASSVGVGAGVIAGGIAGTGAGGL